MSAAETADRLIAAKGQTVTLTRRASGAYNPATGSAAISTTTQTGKGVILPLSAGLKHMTGSNIPSGAVQCLLSAIGITAPKVDDTLTDATGQAWAIIEVSALEPAGSPVMYDLMLRGHE